MKSESSPESLSESGFPIKTDYLVGGEKAGSYPFTRGIYEEMYLRKPWTMRQYAGFGSAEESKDRKSTRLNSSHVSESRMPSSA